MEIEGSSLRLHLDEFNWAAGENLIHKTLPDETQPEFLFSSQSFSIPLDPSGLIANPREGLWLARRIDQRHILKLIPYITTPEQAAVVLERTPNSSERFPDVPQLLGEVLLHEGVTPRFVVDTENFENAIRRALRPHVDPSDIVERLHISFGVPTEKAQADVVRVCISRLTQPSPNERQDPDPETESKILSFLLNNESLGDIIENKDLELLARVIDHDTLAATIRSTDSDRVAANISQIMRSGRAVELAEIVLSEPDATLTYDVGIDDIKLAIRNRINSDVPTAPEALIERLTRNFGLSEAEATKEVALACYEQFIQTPGKEKHTDVATDIRLLSFALSKDPESELIDLPLAIPRAITIIDENLQSRASHYINLRRITEKRLTGDLEKLSLEAQENVREAVVEQLRQRPDPHKDFHKAFSIQPFLEKCGLRDVLKVAAARKLENGIIERSMHSGILTATSALLTPDEFAIIVLRAIHDERRDNGRLKDGELVAQILKENYLSEQHAAVLITKICTDYPPYFTGDQTGPEDAHGFIDDFLKHVNFPGERRSRDLTPQGENFKRQVIEAFKYSHLDTLIRSRHISVEQGTHYVAEMIELHQRATSNANHIDSTKDLVDVLTTPDSSSIFPKEIQRALGALKDIRQRDFDQEVFRQSPPRRSPTPPVRTLN